MNVKIKLHKTIVQPVTTYTSECWQTVGGTKKIAKGFFKILQEDVYKRQHFCIFFSVRTKVIETKTIRSRGPVHMQFKCFYQYSIQIKRVELFACLKAFSHEIVFGGAIRPAIHVAYKLYVTLAYTLKLTFGARYICRHLVPEIITAETTNCLTRARDTQRYTQL